ncbi:MarP family serine protease [Microbacterium awajiense]|uniref:MarP family serine protease n=1 Tax=Microbacterium awajiense TaxID=415214 RepID=UPI0031D207C6
MLVVDVLLVLLLIAGLVVGIRRGLAGSAGVLIGLIAGVLLAFWLVPILGAVWPWPEWRMLALLVAVLVIVGAATAIGAAIGRAVRRGVGATPLRTIDSVLGGVFGLVVALLSVSLVGSTVAAMAPPPIAAAISSSTVLQTVDRFTPRPVSEALARVRAAVLDDGLPRLGRLFEVGPTPLAPPADLGDPDLTVASASVARISGNAYACGTSMTGSGFVVATDRVVTNAHVVAGVEVPVVQLPGEAAREGRIVYFDPIDDLAVIAVDALGVAPLSMGETLAPGAAAVVQGYPYGGPFTMTSAQVLTAGTVTVPDIYADTGNPREVYALAAEVRPGNSGGPLLTADGTVAGVVFARADGDDQRGYAMTMAELLPVATQAAGLSASVATGACTT